MAALLVKFSLATAGRFTLTPSLGVIPCKYPDYLYLLIIVLHDAENRTIVSSSVLTKHRNVL